MESQTSLLARPSNSERSDVIARPRLAEALRHAWSNELASWEAEVAGGDSSSADLWADMPAVDSKTVARMAPIFKQHTGRPLDIRKIRPGGYDSIEEAIQHLVYGDNDSN